jgi:hypothetical protein
VVCNSFEAGKIYYEGRWKGWALEIETFLGPEMATSEASAIWPQPHPPPEICKVTLRTYTSPPTPNPYSLSLHNNLEINSAI